MPRKGDRSSNILKSDLSDAMSVQLYSHITWTFIKGFKKKARWELHKDAACYFKQILEAASNEVAAVQSLASHLKNHPSKMNKTCRTLFEMKGETRKKSFPLDPHLQTHQC